jgi:hypothetical protein
MIIIFLAAKINKLIIFEYLFLFFKKKLFDLERNVIPTNNHIRS